MKTLDLAVVGSGIGGSLIASLNANKNVVLFEKDSNIGGCASTFKKFGNSYNTGATTLVGYEDGHMLKKQFNSIGLKPNISKSNIAIRVVQNNTTIDRIKDFEIFLDNINSVYPNKRNRVFWNKIKEIDEKFWKLENIYYGKYSVKNYIKTSAFIIKLISTFGFDILKNADSFIGDTLGNIPVEYKNFINSQLLITIQSTSKDMTLLALALGLSYPFHDVFYVNGGMGSLLEDIVKNIEVHKNEAIQKIVKDGNNWLLMSNKNEYKTKQLVLNSSIYQSASLFEDVKIKKYYDSFSFSDQSAFVVYMKIKSDEEFLQHYQFIYDELLPNTISNSFFVSFSKKDDKLLSKDGYSVTISTHTKSIFWRNLEKDEYEFQKNLTQEFIIEKFLNYLDIIKKSHIIKYFSATSNTFNRYIGRFNCGGKAIGFKNITELPSSDTPYSGLFNVGDTVFAGQGWPGVSLGVEVLQRQLNGSS